MAKPIESEDEAYQVAQWLNRNKSHARYGEMRSLLVNYMDSKPKPTEEEVAARRTRFGNRVMNSADNPDAPDVFAQPNRAPAPAPTAERGPREFVGPKQEDVGLPRINPEMASPIDALKGAADVGISGLRAMANVPAKFARGMAGGVAGLVNPNDSFAEGYRREADIAEQEIQADRGMIKSERLRTRQGEIVGEAIGNAPVLKQIGAFANAAMNKIEEWTHPVVRDALESALIVGTAGRVGRIPGAPGAITPQQIAALGIDINAPGQVISRQIAEAVSKLSPAVRGDAIAGLQESLRRANVEARGRVAQLYEAAAAEGGRMKVPPKSAMEAAVADISDKYNVLDLNNRAVMPAAAKRLAEVQQWIDLPGNSRIRISDVEKFRQRIENDRRRSRDPDERDALGELLGAVDKWETDAFTRVVAGGNRGAYQAYLTARGARADYASKFGPDQILDNLLNKNNLTTREVRDYIFGASSVIGHKHAAEVVRRMKVIFGDDSPEITALRQDMLFDIVEPLVAQTPSAASLREFLHNYEVTVRRNPELVRELAPFSTSGLDTAYRVAKALDNQGLADSALATRFDPLKIATRILLPGTQPLAHGQAKLNLIDAVVRGVANAAKPNKARVYAELFGRDSKNPMLSIAGRTMLATELASEENEE